MSGASQGLVVVLCAALVIFSFWWKPKGPVNRDVFMVIACCVGVIPVGWLLGIGIMTVLDSFAIVQSVLGVLAFALIIVALARIAYKADHRAALIALLVIAVLASLLPALVFRV